MIACAFCGAEIEADAWFCDQCGQELKVCPTCAKPGKHKRCPNHGAVLVPAKERAAGSPAPSAPVPASAPPAPAPAASGPILGGAAARPAAVHAFAAPVAASAPGLRLVNNTLGLDLSVPDGCVIGRAAGELVHVFSQYPATSSRHCRLHREPGRGWMVTDLGSSNGTFINDQPLAPNQPTALVDGCYLRVANLEFLVTLPAGPGPATPTGTVRL